MERKRILLCLAHMSADGAEQRFVKEAFDSNWVVPLGPNVNGFEKDLEEFVNSGRAAGRCAAPSVDDRDFLCSKVVALSAGTAAVHLALLACGVGPGDEVLVQSFTFCASSHPITYLGATPVFVDSEPLTWNMDPDLLEQAIRDRIAVTGRKPKAIVPVALYGMPYDCDRILEIANRYDIPVVEDAAEGFGSRFRGRVLGTFGRFGVLSFNGNKMITTSGGGALICNGYQKPAAYPQPLPEGRGDQNGVFTADPLYYGVLKEFAEENRNNPTEAERVLWEVLKNKGIGLKFRRQHIIEDFIVDFFCFEKKLTIELDGGYHKQPAQMKSDAERTARLNELGYTELRFTNEQVLGDIDGVVEEIRRKASPQQTCAPLLQEGSGEAGQAGHLAGQKPLLQEGFGEAAAQDAQQIMWYATQAREAYPYYQHEAIGYNYRMSNICAGIGRGQMTIVNDHIAHHRHVQQLYEQLLAPIEGITVHSQPADGRFDSNYWLCTITIDPEVRIVGQENAYRQVITGAVGGAAGVIHAVDCPTTDCQPNDNVEALRVALDKANIEARPLWKPMHRQPVYRNAPAYTNGVSESLFHRGLCLPAGPYVTDDDVRYIASTIAAAIVER